MSDSSGHKGTRSDGHEDRREGSAEAELLGRVLDTLIREDAYGLRSHARTVRRPDGDWLRITLDEGGSVLLPVEPEGFQCDIRARRPVRLECDGPDDAGPDGGVERWAAEGRRDARAGQERVDTRAQQPDRIAPDRAGPDGAATDRAAPASPGPGSAATDRAAPASPGAYGPGPDSARPDSARPGSPAPDRAAPDRTGPDSAHGLGGSGSSGEGAGGGAGRDPVVLTGLDAVLGRLRLAAAPEDRDLYDAFVIECRRALAATRLHERVRPGVVQRLVARYGPRPATQWSGMGGAVAYDTLAAFRDHPVYPTSRGRSVFTETELRAHAPEFHPSFPLRWLALPRETIGGDPARLPPWWPTPSQLGLERGLDADHLAFPVHPLTAGRPLRGALRATGLDDRARLADRPWLDVRPTLSMRTVAVTDDPLTHLKLPLTTATLGLRNRRTIKPGTLLDGAVTQRLVEAVIAREPRFADTVLLADETSHLHAGHELLATLVRRYPPGLEHAQVVPVPALLARTPDGTLVADALAERYCGGDLFALLDAYLTPLFDFHTTLFAHGIALESHQQNTSLVFDDRHPRPRLLIKDHDGPRVHAARLAAVIGDGRAADLCGFDDRRILTAGDGPVADVFTTITVHLCAAALAFELADLGRAPLQALLRLVRDRLTEAVDRLPTTGRGSPGALLRARVLDAARLPVKAMVTAGTLFTKERSGAADINKHYVTGPNYLRRGSGR